MTPDEALSSAARMVRTDLKGTGSASPATEALLSHALADRRAWVEAWPEGAEYVPGLIAQDVQEAMHEHVDPDWPTCPEHRNHALFVEPDLGPDPFWVCYVSGLPVASVGGL